jgi:hypothetical protein
VKNAGTWVFVWWCRQEAATKLHAVYMRVKCANTSGVYLFWLLACYAIMILEKPDRKRKPLTKKERDKKKAKGKIEQNTD